MCWGGEEERGTVTGKKQRRGDAVTGMTDMKPGLGKHQVREEKKSDYSKGISFFLIAPTNVKTKSMGIWGAGKPTLLSTMTHGANFKYSTLIGPSRISF